MTSSRRVQTMPPWAMPSHPWNRPASAIVVQQRSPSTWRSSWSPFIFSDPQAKQLCGSNENRRSTVPGVSLGGTPRSGFLRPVAIVSDVKILDLASFGLDELLAWADLLAHEHREHLVGGLCCGSTARTQRRPRLGVHRRVPELV